MNMKLKILFVFIAVSTLSLFSMKAILWTLLQWGARFALPLALVSIAGYVWSFYLAQSFKGVQLPNSVLIWIWAIGFIEVLILGGLYHLTPQYFPAIVGDFFFN